jgi:hypothetical protein
MDRNICQEGTRSLGGKQACQVDAHGWVPNGQIFQYEPQTCQIFSLAYSTIFYHILNSLPEKKMFTEIIVISSVIIFFQKCMNL